jgi:hypothetical protein
MGPEVLHAFEAVPAEGAAKGHRRAETLRLAVYYLLVASMVDLLMSVQRKMRLVHGATLVTAMLLHRASPHSWVQPQADARDLSLVVSTSETHET